MSKEAENQENQEIQQYIRAGRKFSLAELIGREGGDFLKGDSPVPKLIQTQTAINTFIAKYLQDANGALQAVLQRWVKAEQAIVSQNMESPLVALQQIILKIINNTELYYELVRQVDCQWGQISGDRPHFQQPGQPPHPDDEYTHESVKKQLLKLAKDVDYYLANLDE